MRSKQYTACRWGQREDRNNSANCQVQESVISSSAALLLCFPHYTGAAVVSYSVLKDMKSKAPSPTTPTMYSLNLAVEEGDDMNRTGTRQSKQFLFQNFWIWVYSEHEQGLPYLVKLLMDFSIFQWWVIFKLEDIVGCVSCVFLTPLVAFLGRGEAHLPRELQGKE